jgi:hypothetical protein
MPRIRRGISTIDEKAGPLAGVKKISLFYKIVTAPAA